MIARKRRREHFTPEPARDTSRSDATDTQGSDAAHAALDDALSMWPEVHATTDDLRRLRQRNHFADTMNDALKGHRR